MINRRELITLAAAWSLVSPGKAIAAPYHLFANLIDLGTERNYQPHAQKFTLAVFMTAQKYYASCGESFLGIKQIIGEQARYGEIDPVLVMPRLADQLDPSDRQNLAKAQDYNIRILTGPLPDVLAAAHSVGASFQVDVRGKVAGHEDPANAYFLTPYGKSLAHHPAPDPLRFSRVVGQLLDACRKPENTGVCFG